MNGKMCSYDKPFNYVKNKIRLLFSYTIVTTTYNGQLYIERSVFICANFDDSNDSILDPNYIVNGGICHRICRF